MPMSYQCITECGGNLIAARGSSIDIFDPASGSLLSTWTVPHVQDPKLAEINFRNITKTSEAWKLGSSEDVSIESVPPTKRRKLSTEDAFKEPTSSNEASKEEEALQKGDKRLDDVASGLQTPAIILLQATRDGSHVVAVTGDDKTIRVLQCVQNNGVSYLKQLSERTMPKRPCAIAITATNSTIVSGDKFGDVYSLPLLISDSTEESPNPSNSPHVPETLAKPFAPAANTLTVHSQRNRKALENQKKQISRPAEKTEPAFEHKLLFGHVSMLTDLTLVTLEGRNYILTADRDEHIRVSRGIPQAHIIEGFCLGHTEFISQLCIPESQPAVLISGGGEDELFVWDWLKGVEISRAGLSSLVANILQKRKECSLGNGLAKKIKVAVSAIAHFSLLGDAGPEDLVVVTCEGVPAVFVFVLTHENRLQHTQTLEMPGNVLDIAKGAGARALIISIDSIHQPGSTTERREPDLKAVENLQSLKFQGRELHSSEIKFQPAKDDVQNTRQLTYLLYSLHNLRKREGDAKVDN